MSIIKKECLPSAAQLTADLPLRPQDFLKKQNLEKQLKQVMDGSDSRLLVIVGPCAADYEDALMEYVFKLSILQREVQTKLLIVPRLYTSKPRSAFDGYTGMVFYPAPDEHQNIAKGIYSARSIHLRALCEFGMISADELLYSDLLEYLQDVVSYFVVGARSVEYQLFPWLASGLDCPVGIKNPRCGEPRILVNAVASAQKPHTFTLGGTVVTTTGNKYAHGILRGYSDSLGNPHSNFALAHEASFSQLYREQCDPQARLIIDCSHDNSEKKAANQVGVVQEVLTQINSDPSARNMIMGFMIESYLLSGKTCGCGHNYGESIMDECIGWEETQDLIRQIADRLP